jgi:pimeloyl-ACP methyl ester carboxylesterase
MKVIFSHGKESGPWGSKIQHLAGIARQAGCEIDSIDYTDSLDPDQRVERLLERLKMEQGSVLLVGSSMGGYVALAAAEQVAVAGIFLMAPALYLDGYRLQHYQPLCQQIEIVHSWSDNVVPVAGSIRFARAVDCPLHLISGDHRLNSSLDTVAELFNLFLARVITGSPIFKKDDHNVV